MKINVWISDSGSSAEFAVDTETGKITVKSDGCMPVEKIASRVKTWTGSPKDIKSRVERAWNRGDCESAEFDPYKAEITNEDGGDILAA